MNQENHRRRPECGSLKHFRREQPSGDCQDERKHVEPRRNCKRAVPVVARFKVGLCDGKVGWVGILLEQRPVLLQVVVERFDVVVPVSVQYRAKPIDCGRSLPGKGGVELPIHVGQCDRLPIRLKLVHLWSIFGPEMGRDDERKRPQPVLVAEFVKRLPRELDELQIFHRPGSAVFVVLFRAIPARVPKRVRESCRR